MVCGIKRPMKKQAQRIVRQETQQRKSAETSTACNGTCMSLSS